MANQEHLEILKQGVKVWNEWREKIGVMVPRLSGAILDSADLTYANLRSADLRRAQLRDAYLSGADLGGARLTGAPPEILLLRHDLFPVRLLRAILLAARLPFPSFRG